MNNIENFDMVIIGAGMYGLYAAKKTAATRRQILVVEREPVPFARASYINQARIHNGYHYPRSLSTALKSAKYYKRFLHDYGFAINNKFEKIYAVSSDFSYASSDNFKNFCRAANIPCEEAIASRWFKNNTVERAFRCEECAFDYAMIRDSVMEELSHMSNVEFAFSTKIIQVNKDNDEWLLTLSDSRKICTKFVLNATYASINQLQDLFGFDMLDIKYEICEMIICDVSDNIKDIGLTVMDGPFFSIMPFGLTGKHSLSAVHFTPHDTSLSKKPEFICQQKLGAIECGVDNLENCNCCTARPVQAWPQMRQLSKKYLNDDIDIIFHESIWAIKPILKSAEIDDGRPTLVRTLSDSPRFVSVLSGKINTIYDLDEVIL